MAPKDDHPALSPDPLVKRLVPNPDEVPELVAVSGWLGKSARKSHLRLYLTPSMSVYLEVPAGDIVYAEKVGDEDSGLGGTMLWLHRDAKVRLQSNESMSAEEAYLEGQIARISPPTPISPSNPFPPTYDPRRCLWTQFPTTRFTWLCYGRKP